MNSDNHEKCADGEVIPNLATLSVIIMDSMSFHRKQVDKLLTSSPLKKDMLEYL
jgi:hypothetical protein